MIENEIRSPHPTPPCHTHTLFKTCSCALWGLIVPGVGLTPRPAPQPATLAPRCVTHLFSSADLSSSDRSLMSAPTCLTHP